MTISLPYSLYILHCNDATYYTGITADLKRRIYEHNTSVKAAKYTRSRRPVVLVYYEVCLNKFTALNREKEIKRFTLAQKVDLIFVSGITSNVEQF